MNGKEISTSGFVIDSNKVVICKKNSKEKDIPTHKIFGIKTSDGTEKIIYNIDSLNDDFFTVEQMRKYIEGEKYALKYYHGYLSFFSGTVLGSAGAFTYKSVGLASILIPAIGNSVISSVSSKNIHCSVSDSLSQNQFFILGYKEKVKDIKWKKSIMGGLLGYFVCLLFYI
jgi:hypothetical protein